MGWNHHLGDIGGANEPGMIYFPAKWGAKELQNPKNHRVVILTQQLANQFKLLGVTYLVAKVKFELFCWSFGWVRLSKYTLDLPHGKSGKWRFI